MSLNMGVVLLYMRENFHKVMFYKLRVSFNMGTVSYS